MTEEKDERTVTLRFSLQGEVPLSLKFGRDAPAALEGPEEAWTLAQQVIDHGAHILETVSEVAAGRQIRDLVLAALLRRSLTTAEAVRRCLFNGLEESAVVLLRTLLDAELNLRLVTSDSTDLMARRLAAYHYLKAKRHVTSVLGHPEIRNGDQDFKSFMKGAGRRQKGFFGSANFDDIRDDLASSQYWHGFKSIEAAFESIGGGTDYLQLYDSFSPFVHAGNLDFDFTEIVDGRPHLRPFAQRDPKPIQHYLQGLVLILLRILSLYLEDKDAEDYSDSITVTFESEEEIQISPLMALQHEANAMWGDASSWVVTDQGSEEPRG